MPEVVKQLSVFLENKPGVLASVGSALASAKINVTGMSVSDTVDHAVVRLVLSDPNRARDIFEEAGVLVIETDVLAMRLTHEPGQLAQVALKLSEVEQNIDYLYGSACSISGGEAIIYLRVGDVAKAKTALDQLESGDGAYSNPRDISEAAPTVKRRPDER